MNTTEVRELTLAELEQVAGGADPNYKFCWDGPAGSGVYPLYVDCNRPTWGELIRNTIREVQEAGRGGRPA